MENIIFGFGTEIHTFTVKEIYQYLLVFACMAIIAGRYAERYISEKRYSTIIRYGMRKKWWRRGCLHIILLDAAIVAVMFVVYVLYCTVVSGEPGTHLPEAFFLWLMGLVTISMCQLLLSIGRVGGKLSFLLVITIEILSIYAGVISQKAAPWFPGSYFMVNRSRVALQQGYFLELILGVELILAIVIVLFGHCLYRRK